MEILAPSVYLKTLGWTVGETENGLKKLIKDDTEIPNIESSPICPKTELELLQALITIGYMPENGDILAERMKTSNDGLMTTLASPPCNNLKTSPSPPLSDSPSQPTLAPPSTTPPSYTYPEKTLLSLHPLPESFYEYIPSIPSFSTPTSNDYAASTSTQTTPPSSAPPQQQQVPLQEADTDTDANATILRFETIFDHEAFDIDSPWDVNVVLGYTTMPLANSNAEYDAREDFHFAF
ncbi:hypothetical protein K4F52_003393 [Lecanicillium sp. MT-2017a]|nr:hypothetical protein K4F52_003393 [Lecanicillium sp. MT-2017a]